MKIWTRICITFLFSLTFIIFISGILILFLKVKTIDNNPESARNGLDLIKEYKFLPVLESTSKYHKYIDHMFDPRWSNPEDESGMLISTPGALYFASGLNLLIVGLPVMLFFDIFILLLMLKKTLYPVSEIFINELLKMKKDKKLIKSEFKEKIKSANTKKDKINQKNLLKQNLLFIQKAKLETKNKINMEYKLKHKYIYKAKKNKNEV